MAQVLGDPVASPPADGITRVRFSRTSPLLLASSWDKVRSSDAGALQAVSGPPGAVGTPVASRHAPSACGHALEMHRLLIARGCTGSDCAADAAWLYPADLDRSHLMAPYGVSRLGPNPPSRHGLGSRHQRRYGLNGCPDALHSSPWPWNARGCITPRTLQQSWRTVPLGIMLLQTAPWPHTNSCTRTKFTLI